MTQTVSRDHLSHVAHLWLSDATPPDRAAAAAAVPTVPVWALLADYLNADPLNTAVALADFWGRQGGRVAIVRVGEQSCSLWRVGPDQSAVANRNVVFSPEALECREAISRGRPKANDPLDMSAAIEAVGQWANRILLLVDPDESELLAAADELLLVIQPNRRDLLEAYRVFKRIAPNMPAAKWGGVCLDAESAADGADAMERLRDTAIEHLGIDLTDRGFLLREADAVSPQRTRLAEGAGTANPDTVEWLGKWLGTEPKPVTEAEVEVEPKAEAEAASPCSRLPAVVPLLEKEVSSDALLTSVLAELHLVLPGVRSVNGSTRSDARPITRLMDSDGRGVLLAACVDDPIFLLADLAELLIADGFERRIILIHRNLPARTAALIRCLKFDIELLEAIPVSLPSGAGVLLASADANIR